jgi:hypothetical protein
MATNEVVGKVAYQTPTVTKIGDFESATQHTGHGDEIDATFAAHTPVSQLTLS